jgi:hypothetical protein
MGSEASGTGRRTATHKAQRWLILAFVLAAVMFGYSSAPARADGGSTGSTSTASVSTDKSTYAPGDTLSIMGSGFEPNENVSVVVMSDTAASPISDTVVADASGGVADQLTLPSENGDYTVSATGTASGATSSAAFQVFFSGLSLGDSGPNISSDQADYPPGATVTLTGSGWGPQEAVHVTVEDNTGQMWSWSGNSTAGNDGAFTTSLTLPDFFVASYLVTATGASGTATTTFTDGNIKVKSAGGINFGFTFQGFTGSTNCSTGGGTTQSGTGDTNGQTVSSSAGDSVLITANLNANAPNSSATFKSWGNPNGLTITVGSLTTRTICVAGFGSGSKDLIGNYDQVPTITRANATVTVNEGSAAANNGTYSDPDTGDNVSITASVGTVTKTGTNSGNWNWSFTPTDGPTQSQTVTITADDGTTTTSTTFALTVNNVTPVVTAPANQNANEGSSTIFNLGSFTDPGADNPWTVNVTWGDASAPTNFTQNTTGTLTTQSHTYDDNGTYTVTETVKDKDNATSIAKTFTVTVANVAPTATFPATRTVSEGSPSNFAFTSPSDPSSADTTAEFHYAYSCTGASLGGATYAGSGTATSVNCTFDDGPSTPTVRARIIDKDGGFTEYTTAVTVNNVAPTATFPATRTVDEGSLSNFAFTGPSDPSSADTTAGFHYAYSCTGASLAGATYAGSGTATSVNCTFPDGPASATVRARIIDKDGGFTEYTTAVTVDNVAPVAVADTFAATEDTQKVLPLSGAGSPSANDTDVPADPLTVTAVSNPTNGTVQITGGNIVFTPAADFCGTAGFDYTVSDGDGGTDTGHVTLNVACVNDAPSGADNTVTTLEDNAYTFTTGDFGFSDPNDTPPDQLAFVKITTLPSNGSLSNDGNPLSSGDEISASDITAGKLVFTPAANANGSGYANFNFKVRDNGGTANSGVDLSTTANTITIDVTSVNDAPSFTKGANQSVPEDSGAHSVSNWATNISPGPANESSQTVQFVVTDNSNPSLFATGPAVSPSGTLAYTPAANANGSATIKLKAKDSGGRANGGIDESPEQTFTITVTEVNDPPVAAADSAAVDEDDATGVLIDVLANDSKGPANESGQTLTITNVSTPAHGTAVVESGKIRYTPTEANYNGPDSFTYTIRDDGTTNGVNDFKSDTATVSITVRPVNDKPTVAADNASRTVDEGQTATNTGTWGDVDGDTVTLSASRGTVVKNANGTWSWSFATNDGPTQSGPVTITANDGHGGTGNVTFQLTVNNVAPTITTLTSSAQVVPAGGTSMFTATFTDPGTADTHQTPPGGSCVFNWDGAAGSPPVVTESNGSGNCKSTGTFATPGVYTITVTLTDDDGGSTTSTTNVMIAVYDPNAGFVTGGGWITSPAGSYRADTTLSGRANFGFNAKYQKGQSIPTGETEFDFQLGNLNFHSESYDWLVVSGNASKAQYKGKGSINGQTGFGFLLTAYDGSPDKFRIKIWNIATSAIVYDNNYGVSDDIDSAVPTAISGGSIVIHK